MLQRAAEIGSVAPRGRGKGFRAAFGSGSPPVARWASPGALVLPGRLRAVLPGKGGGMGAFCSLLICYVGELRWLGRVWWLGP